MIVSATHCPNCDAKAPNRLARRLLSLFALVGMGSLSMTLMACYGNPCVNDKDCQVPPPDDMSAQVDLKPVPIANVDGGSDGGS